VFSGLSGWKLVPRFSSTPVATWTWPTWVVSRRRVLEAVFVLLEPSSPSRRIFIGSHSLPPLSGSPYRSFTLRLCCARFGLADLFVFAFFTKEDGFSPVF
jgi:hypothetical protein